MLLSTPPEIGTFCRAGSDAVAVGLETSDGVGEGAGVGVALAKGFVAATSDAGVGVGAGVGAAAFVSGVGVAKTFVVGVAAATVLKVKEASPSGSLAAAGFGRSSESGPSGPGLRDAALSRFDATEESLPTPRLFAPESGVVDGGTEAT